MINKAVRRALTYIFDRTVPFCVFLQALEQEEDVDEETAEFIPIDSVDLTGEESEEEETEVEEQLSSPLSSPKSTGLKQAKKTSITPVLSKDMCMAAVSCCLKLNSLEKLILNYTLNCLFYHLQRRKLQ